MPTPPVTKRDEMRDSERPVPEINRSTPDPDYREPQADENCGCPASGSKSGSTSGSSKADQDAQAISERPPRNPVPL